MTRADGLKLACGSLALALSVAFGPGGLTLGGPAALFVLLMIDGIFRPASPWLLPVLTRAGSGRPQVALTFDDGPDPEVTPRVLDALAEAGAKATFFVIGRAVRAHPELAARIVREGHQLGNHSDTHPRTLNFRGARGMAAEVEAGAAAIAALSGAAEAPAYRPPIGLKSPALARVARRRGLKVVQWSLHGRDTGGANAARIRDRVLSRVRAGDVVLLHDGHDAAGPPRAATADALPEILRGLEARGLEPVTVSELFDPS